MQPREHLVVFAKRMIPAKTFRSPEQMFAELTGPKREAFVFHLWNEAGEQVARPLPHVDKFRGSDGIPRVAKLGVVGALRPVGHEIVVISMPPAINVNEVLFLALVRRPTGVSVFFYERCMGNDHATVAANEAVLAEARADGSRLNHGFKEGIDLDAFKVHLGGVLGVSLAGLETSLPAISAADFVNSKDAAAPERGGDSAVTKRLGGALVVMATICAIEPLIVRVPGLGFYLWMVLRYVDFVLGAAVVLSLLFWVFRVHLERMGRTTFSPLGSLGMWALPVAQVVTIPMTVASALRGATGRSWGGLVLLWWLFCLPVMVLQLSRYLPETRLLPPGVWEVLFSMWWFVEGAAYGLLAYLVKKGSDAL